METRKRSDKEKNGPELCVFYGKKSRKYSENYAFLNKNRIARCAVWCIIFAMKLDFGRMKKMNSNVRPETM